MTKVKLRFPKPETKSYAPVGRCIYCGKTPQEIGHLSREHIIPYGLNGTLILPKASCHACREITGEIERSILQRTLMYPRVDMNFASRRWRRNKSLPPPMLVGRKGSSGEVDRWEAVPKDIHPYHWLTCHYAPAGILAGRSIADEPLVGITMIPATNWKDRMKSVRRDLVVDYKIDTGDYQRMIAKIAHSFAVAIRGLDTFEPILQDIICTKSKEMHYYVGGAPDIPGDPRYLHSLELFERDQLLLVSLKLFAHLDKAPAYLVVVGRPR